MLSGKWTYRSFRNRRELVLGDPEGIRELIDVEGVLELHQSGDGRVEGGFGTASGHALRITGSVGPQGEFSLLGEGPGGTATAGWRYVYRGVPGFIWPQGEDKVPSLLGTVLCFRAQGSNAVAGHAACFIAVRHSDHPPPRTLRPLSSLLR